MNVIRINIIKRLKQQPSYLKWGVERLARKFDCSTKLMQEIVIGLADYKQEYIKNIVKLED